MGVFSEVPSARVIRSSVRRDEQWSTLGAVASRLAAGLLIIATLPVAVTIAFVILLLSRRSPLVGHRRTGRYGRPFWMWKFRTMWDGGNPNEVFTWLERLPCDGPAFPKIASDPRITSRFARFCRKYSLDELPQLLHVVSGRMAFVGPRPLTAAELLDHYGPAASEVLQAKPGLTGLWQVRGRNSLTYRQRRRLDLFFVRHRTLRLRSMILLRTVAVVASGEDAV